MTCVAGPSGREGIMQHTCTYTETDHEELAKLGGNMLLLWLRCLSVHMSVSHGLRASRSRLCVLGAAGLRGCLQTLNRRAGGLEGSHYRATAGKEMKTCSDRDRNVLVKAALSTEPTSQSNCARSDGRQSETPYELRLCRAASESSCAPARP